MKIQLKFAENVPLTVHGFGRVDGLDAVTWTPSLRHREGILYILRFQLVVPDRSRFKLCNFQCFERNKHFEKFHLCLLRISIRECRFVLVDSAQCDLVGLESSSVHSFSRRFFYLPQGLPGKSTSLHAEEMIIQEFGHTPIHAFST